MAKRVVIFVLLGPILVWLSWMILHLPDLFLKPGGSSAGPFFLMVLLFVMALGIIPGAVLAWVDRVMTDRGLPLAVRVVVG